jgi:hypothetical protein
MAEIKFGTSQINNPTPSRINLIVRIFNVISGVFMGWMMTTPNGMIGTKTQAYISSILGLAIALVNGLAPLFGIELDRKTVPADQVTAMDEKKTDS